MGHHDSQADFLKYRSQQHSSSAGEGGPFYPGRGLMFFKHLQVFYCGYKSGTEENANLRMNRWIQDRLGKVFKNNLKVVTPPTFLFCL